LPTIIPETGAAAHQAQKENQNKACMLTSVVVNYNTRGRSKMIARSRVREGNSDPNAKNLQENKT
jgi:hypothetical protein